MLKKIGIVVAVILVLAAIGFGLMVFRLSKMASNIEGELTTVSNINLSKVADGVYEGSCGDFVVNTSVKVAVKNHRIEKIVITKQDCGPGYEAKDTVNRIIKAQSPRVDAVTGASSSSRTIMVAVYRALLKGIK